MPGAGPGAGRDARAQETMNPDPSPPPPPAAVDNRRNFYRLLHVQPEAPLAVIQASYRTLMSRLRAHPDLGGDHDQAVLLNEAWAVLSDPQRRASYDLGLRQLVESARAEPPAPSWVSTKPNTAPAAFTSAFSSLSGHATSSAAAATWAGRSTAGPDAQGPVRLQPQCPLCGHASSMAPRPDSRCTRCQAPLAALPEPGRQGHELLGRRDAVRRDQSHVAMLHIGWPSHPLPVRWRDLSLTGLSFYAPAPLAAGQRIHLIDSALEAVAQVVDSRPQGRVYTVHARLLSALLLQATGVFVAAQA